VRFILIHGGFHGAWCWERVLPELAALGHDAVAIDLPGHGERRDEDSTIENRRDAILEVMRGDDVLVGHSGGGFDITLAADAAPDKVAHLVYLAATLPLEGRSLMESVGGAPAKEDGVTQLMSDETGMLRFIRPTPRGWMEWHDFAGAHDFFYHDCSEQDARWAFERLSPAPVGFNLVPVSFANFWKADLPRSFIHCLQDRAKPHRMAARVIERLGVKPFEIDASHSPFLSQPRACAELIVEAARSRPIGPLRPN
jgi:pimeloyl-ACP methyl ester carboxylesterase